MKAEIKSFCEEFAYPQEATAALVDTLEKLEQTEWYPLFRGYVRQYEDDECCFNYRTALAVMQKIADQTGLSRYTLDLLFFISLAKHCRELYEEAGLPLKIYHDSMSDLKWKLQECHSMYGIWGSFVASWFPRFFDLSRFALGRLQFEEDLSSEMYSSQGIDLKYGDWILNVHIPSSGKLRMEDCMDSLREAADFYADRFPDHVAKFRCHSWLLNQHHKKYISPESGIYRFGELFDVVRTDIDEKGSDLWRIFNRSYEGSTDGFPADTSLQRAYLKMLHDGAPTGWGLGYIYMKDGEIINRK